MIVSSRLIRASPNPAKKNISCIQWAQSLLLCRRLKKGRVTLVTLRHPRGFQAKNEITSLCFVSKHLVHKFHAAVSWRDGECRKALLQSGNVWWVRAFRELWRELGKYPNIVMATERLKTKTQDCNGCQYTAIIAHTHLPCWGTHSHYLKC